MSKKPTTWSPPVQAPTALVAAHKLETRPNVASEARFFDMLYCRTPKENGSLGSPSPHLLARLRWDQAPRHSCRGAWLGDGLIGPSPRKEGPTLLTAMGAPSSG